MKSNSWPYAPNPKTSQTHGELGTYLFGGWYWMSPGKKYCKSQKKHPETKINKQKTSYVLPCYFWLHQKWAENSFPAVLVPTNLAVTRIAKPLWNRLWQWHMWHEFIRNVCFGTPCGLHPWKLTWHWKIPMFNSKYIFKWWIYHCPVSFFGGISP